MKAYLTAASVIASLAIGPAAAQDQGSLINVSLKNIQAEIARNLNLKLEDVPLTLQLPITVAANICGTSVNVLSAQIQAGKNSCSASNVSLATQTVTNTVGAGSSSPPAPQK
jgi:hypothetical protein